MSGDDRSEHTEYGGGEGSPQRFADGRAKDLSVSEAARVVRMAGMQGDLDASVHEGEVFHGVHEGVGSDGMDLSDDVIAQGLDEDARRSRLRELRRLELLRKTNRYSDNVDELLNGKGVL